MLQKRNLTTSRCEVGEVEALKIGVSIILKKHLERFKKTSRTFSKKIPMFFKNHRDDF